MSDQVLVELAAKAVGRRVTGWNIAQGEAVAVLDDGSFWQPLHRNRITDADGDALRLAVGLGFINPGCWPDASREMESLLEAGTPDWNVATRRAIVKAAAKRAEQLTHSPETKN